MLSTPFCYCSDSPLFDIRADIPPLHGIMGKYAARIQIEPAASKSGDRSYVRYVPYPTPLLWQSVYKYYSDVTKITLQIIICSILQ